MMTGSRRVLCLAAALLAARVLAQGPPVRVSLVMDSEPGPGTRHGSGELQRQLAAKGIAVERIDALSKARASWILAVGVCSNSKAAAELAGAAGLTLPSEPESLIVHSAPWTGKNTLLICGADDRGTMYAALDVAEQIRLSAAGANPLSAVENAREKPDVRERSVTRMLMNRSEVERYLYSEQFWERYLGMLAKDRYNTLVLMFGYGSAGYFDPVYPFLFDVPEFREVRVTGITKEEQDRNTAALDRIIRMAHERALDVRVALWTHIFVPGYNNVLKAEEPRPGFVTGLTDRNLIPYTKLALGRFLKRFPGIAGLQFRVHTESSVTLRQQRNFWTEILKTVGEAAPGILVDMRAKGFTDDLIDTALASPVKMRMATKHWGEQLGLPYHPTEDSLANKYKRRHSYADLLRYPRRYDMLWRLWSHGTVRILLWGDPEFARRFVDSTRLWAGQGFDIHESLAMKMGYKLGLHNQPPYDVLSERHRYYDWEFERYWHYYQVFGRLGYSLDTPPRVWKAEFQQRFGAAALPVEEACHQASRILPRIVAYALRDLSAGFAWAEKQRWEDLPDYINVRPSDTAMFLGIEEAARFHVAGMNSPKIWPLANSEWFARQSEVVMNAVKEAERTAGAAPGREFISTMIDMKILANLAEYHSRRLRAGWHYALALETRDLHAYDEALHWERQAIESWKKIVAAADGVYPDNIIFGQSPRMDGSWKTELVALEKGLAGLEAKRGGLRLDYRETVARLDFGDGPAGGDFRQVTSRHNYSLAKGGYGWHHVYAKRTGSAANGGSTDPLADFVTGPEDEEYAHSAFGIDLPNGNYELLFSMTDRSAAPADHGPMWIIAQGKTSTDRFRVAAGDIVEKRLRAVVVDGRLNIAFHCATDGDWIVNQLVVERVEPAIGHVPVRRWRPGEAIPIRVTASGPDPIRSVYLVYGHPDTTYRRLIASHAGEGRYGAVIPQSDVADGMEYYLEAVDSAGRRVTSPPAGADGGYRIRVAADEQAPLVRHRAVERATPNEPLAIEAYVTDPAGVASVHVRYRGLNQHQDFARLRLLPAGEENQYGAEIPGEDIDPAWDFMYYLEVADRYGNAAIYPDLDKETPYVVVETQ